MEYYLSGDINAFIHAAGYAGIFAIIFAESGLFFGFFLPGDSLLFTAGIFASQGFFSITLLIILTFFAAILGDSVGYWFGFLTGPKLFRKKNSFFFHKDHVARAKNFYARHGGKAILLARFLPIVRTFAPIVAGIGGMNYRAFLFFNVLGAVLWAMGVPLAGFLLGQSIPHIDKYLLPIILGIIVLSLLPSVPPFLKARKKRRGKISYKT